MIVARVTVFPEIPPQPNGGGGFVPGSFDHMLHLRVDLPGLDRAWEHTLIDATVAEDRGSAELTVHSVPRAALTLDRSLRIVTWTPPAHVRAHDTDGNVLAEGRFDAPLQPGQAVEVNGCPECGRAGGAYRVAPAEDHELWPHRDRATGVCRGAIDWQHVRLVAEPQAPHHPTPAAGQ